MKLSLGPLRLPSLFSSGFPSCCAAIGCLAALALVPATTAATLTGCSGGGDDIAPPGPVSFVAEPPADGAVVFLRSLPPAPASGDRVVLEVVARGVPDLHGTALRLTYDTVALGFVSAETGGGWSKQAVASAKEGAPGQLAVIWSEKGQAGIAATGETVLGKLTFDVRGRKGTPVAFKVERSLLVDRRGDAVAVTWRGGAFAPR